jgi:hypothetical protein
VAGGKQVALYARVASHDQKEDAQRQLQRLRDYAAANGYRVNRPTTIRITHRLASNKNLTLIVHCQHNHNLMVGERTAIQPVPTNQQPSPHLIQQSSDLVKPILS